MDHEVLDGLLRRVIADERLLELIKPDVLVKGGDYERDSVVGWQIVESYGGRVAVVDFLDDCSTTAIVKKIQG